MSDHHSHGSSEETRINNNMESEKGGYGDVEGLSPEYAGLIKYIQDSAQGRGKADGEDDGNKIVHKRSWLTPWRKEKFTVDKSGNLVKDTGARVTPAAWYACWCGMLMKG